MDDALTRLRASYVEGAASADDGAVVSELFDVYDGALGASSSRPSDLFPSRWKTAVGRARREVARLRKGLRS